MPEQVILMLLPAETPLPPTPDVSERFALLSAPAICPDSVSSTALLSADMRHIGRRVFPQAFALQSASPPAAELHHRGQFGVGDLFAAKAIKGVVEMVSNSQVVVRHFLRYALNSSI